MVKAPVYEFTPQRYEQLIAFALAGNLAKFRRVVNEISQALEFTPQQLIGKVNTLSQLGSRYHSHYAPLLSTRGERELVKCCSAWGHSLAFAACMQQNAGIVRYLLGLGLCFNKLDDRGVSTLHVAAFFDNFEVLSLLLKRRTFEHIDSIELTMGFSALKMAVASFSVDCARLLFEFGADPTQLDFMGRSALTLAEELDAQFKDPRSHAMLTFVRSCCDGATRKPDL